MQTIKNIFISALLVIFVGVNQPFAVETKFHTPKPDSHSSPITLATIDFLLPGYGMYVQNEKWTGALYFGLNIISLGSIYFAYRHWRYSESVYQAGAWRQRQEMDHIYLEDPTGSGYASLQELENRAGRAQLFFAVSILANVVLRSLSAYHSWLHATELHEQNGPRYEFYPDAQGKFTGRVGYSFQF
ncbi:MAG: hypothetical protein LDLANPLL_00920 [Turneriella sp.]|nr:hypothetical protein [Turneriella sp.]